MRVLTEHYGKTIIAAVTAALVFAIVFSLIKPFSKNESISESFKSNEESDQSFDLPAAAEEIKLSSATGLCTGRAYRPEELIKTTFDSEISITALEGEDGRDILRSIKRDGKIEFPKAGIYRASFFVSGEKSGNLLIYLSVN